MSERRCGLCIHLEKRSEEWRQRFARYQGNFCPISAFFDVRHNVGMEGCRLANEEACPAFDDGGFEKAVRRIIKAVNDDESWQVVTKAVNAVERLLKERKP